ncbi:MAG: hypothetical protein Ct9H300mP28_08540 [Pseudomonadota bacterium]|nr:MAG: hypothetical protein Ct9H300mP28_08540 [Pseudomonadota bacterium]
MVQGGFEYFERLEGIYTDEIVPDDLGYNDYFLSKGYEGKNPWENWETVLLITWQKSQRLADAKCKSSAVSEEHSETAYTTGRALEFFLLFGNEDQWCLHLS